MEISEIIMETFTLGTAIGLNMTHDASFCAESVKAAAWNRARLVKAKLSCFCCIPANSPGFPGILQVFHQISRSPG